MDEQIKTDLVSFGNAWQRSECICVTINVGNTVVIHSSKVKCFGITIDSVWFDSVSSKRSSALANIRIICTIRMSPNCCCTCSK